MAGFFDAPAPRRPVDDRKVLPPPPGILPTPARPGPSHGPLAALGDRVRQRFAGAVPADPGEEGGGAAPAGSRWRGRRFTSRPVLAAVVLVVVVSVVLVVGGVVVLTRWSPPGGRRAPAAGAAAAAAVPLSTLPLIEAGAPGVGAAVTGGDGAATASPEGRARPNAGSRPGSNPATNPTSTTTITAPLVIHAAGEVVHPGVYLLPFGARVDDVVAAAGGLTARADPDVINLAARVNDGQRVFVPQRGRSVPAVVAGASAGADGVADGVAPTDGVATDAGASGSGRVDLNTASAAQLDALPGVGPATAAAILEYRRVHGRFRSVTQLLDVPGIGDAKLAALRARVTVSGG